MQTEPILRVKGVSKAFPGVQALTDVDFEAYPGEVVTLDGSGILMPDDLAGLFEVSGLSHIRLSGFRMINAGTHNDNAGIMALNQLAKAGLGEWSYGYDPVDWSCVLCSSSAWRVADTDFGPVPVPAPLVQQVTRWRITQAFNIFLDAVDIAQRQLVELRLAVDQPEVLVRPQVGAINLFDQVDVGAVTALGADAMESALPQLQDAVALPARIKRGLKRSLER